MSDKSVCKDMTLNCFQGYLARNLRAAKRARLATKARTQEPETRNRARGPPSRTGSFLPCYEKHEFDFRCRKNISYIIFQILFCIK